MCIIKYNGSITLDEWNEFYTISNPEDTEIEIETELCSKNLNLQFEEELTYEEYEEEK